MAPKTRSSKEKSEWRVCPDTGRMFHSGDAVAHAAWLSSGSSAGAAPPRYPHVAGKQFVSPVQLMEDKTGLGPVTLSESVKYVSIFLPKPLLNPCQIGFASWVRVTCGGGFEAVLRAFPLCTAATTTAAAVKTSWLARALEAGSVTEEDMLIVETFRYCKQIICVWIQRRIFW